MLDCLSGTKVEVWKGYYLLRTLMCTYIINFSTFTINSHLDVTPRAVITLHLYNPAVKQPRVPTLHRFLLILCTLSVNNPRNFRAKSIPLPRETCLSYFSVIDREDFESTWLKEVWTHYLLITRSPLNHCAPTTAPTIASTLYRLNLKIH